MRKVKYNKIGNVYLASLRDGSVYDVIRYFPYDIDHRYDQIEINVNGLPLIFNIHALTIEGRFFEDVTAEFRNEIIDDILV